jgi:cardiolipin synthase
VSIVAPPDPPKIASCDYCHSDSFTVEAQGHTFTFHPDGGKRLEAVMAHIEGARETLDIFYYMFQDDETGVKVRDALIAARRRGVKVHLIIDSLGSDAPDEFFDPLIEAGGTFAQFSADFGVRYLIRNHQKFIISDGRSVMTGGANISNHYYDSPENNGWCDLGVAIEGEVVGKFTEWFGLLVEWVAGEGSQFRRIRTMVRNFDGSAGGVTLTVGGPFVRKSNWVMKFKRDMFRAQRLDFVTAYFSPTRTLRRLMAKLARRGEARMIMAGKSDIDATIQSARLLYKNLLRAGAKIYEFQPCKLHMKLIVVDNVSYFGSANLDKRSVRINVELMVRVEDEALADRLRQMIDHLEQASSPITPKWYAETATWWRRFKWRLTYYAQLADYRMARALNPDT